MCVGHQKLRMGESKGEDRGSEENSDGVGGGRQTHREILLQTGLRDLITVKHWTLIGGIKTFYGSSCSEL